MRPVRANWWRRALLSCVAAGVLTATAILAGEDSAPSADDLPGWISLAPLLVALLVALIWRTIIPALFAGVWIGAWTIAGLNSPGLALGLCNTFEIHVLNAVADRDHASILLFSMMIGGMVGICLENGGMRGLARPIAKLAKTRRRAQSATAGLGLFIFFDDYANLLIVGNVMRPINDRLRVSREKLAYLVDSTAAPVAAVGFMTTWIGFEVGVIDESLRALGQVDVQPYGLFLRSLTYSYYPWLALLLVVLVAVSGRDFGPMAKAEEAALRAERAENLPVQTEGSSDAIPQGQASALYALIPIAVMVAAMLASLSATGQGETLWQRIATADAMVSLLRGSLLGVVAAVAITLVGRRLSLQETMTAWYRGAESLLLGLITLILAWALADTMDQLGTASYLCTWIDSSVPVGLLPSIIFVMAAAASLSTGSAWGTMGLLMPLSIPLVWQQASLTSGAQVDELIAATVAAVLGGAVFGDHCSPISDTTILSATASGCDHLSHVRTQLPYALLSAGIATVFGMLPASLGGAPPLACLGLAMVALTLTFFAVSKPIPIPQTPMTQTPADTP